MCLIILEVEDGFWFIFMVFILKCFFMGFRFFGLLWEGLKLFFVMVLLCCLFLVLLVVF